jgi:hypothetical protein
MPGGVIGTSAHPKALWPGVRVWFGRTYNEHAKEWTDLVDVENSDQHYEEAWQVTGFGLVPIKGEGAGTAYDSEVQGFGSRFTHLTYSLGYIVTQEEIEDNLYEKVSGTRARALAFSNNQTVENVVANLYNRGFNSSYTGGDGVSLFNTAHPNTSGGTYSNMLAVGADLSEASLEDLIIQVMGATDDRGLLISLMTKSLHIGRQEFFNANRILKSVFQSGTANNDINVLKATNSIPEGIKVNHYFTAPHAWFLRTNVDKGQGMVFYQRVALSFTQDNDFDTDNAKAKSRQRFSCGWIDPRCAFGSNGP